MSSLSVEAQCFVPGSSAPAGHASQQPPPQQPSQKTPQQGEGKPSGQGSTKKKGKKIPKYMTSCYPFVQGDPGPPPNNLPASLQSTGRPPPSSSTETATGTSPTRQPAPQQTAPRQTAPRQTGRQITKHSHNTSSSSATLSNTTVPLAHSAATAHGLTQGPTQGATPRGLSPVGHTPPGHTPPMLMSSPSPSGTVPRLHSMMPQFRKPPPMLPSHAQSGGYRHPMSPGGKFMVPPHMLPGGFPRPPLASPAMLAAAIHSLASEHSEQSAMAVTPDGVLMSPTSSAGSAGLISAGGPGVMGMGPGPVGHGSGSVLRAPSPTPSIASTYRTGSTPTTPQGYMSPTPFMGSTFQSTSLGWAAGSPTPHAQPPIGTAPSGMQSLLQGQVYPPRYSVPMDTSDQEQPEATPPPSRTKHKAKKKKDSTSHMVSVGVQNETLPTKSRKKGRTKTMILMDASNQTDFSDAIANLTLMEHSNTLYNEHRTWHDHYDDQDYGSSESEEVDSDSGYSSPLHRRNTTTTSNPPAVPTHTPHTPHTPAEPTTSASSHPPQGGMTLVAPQTVLPSSATNNTSGTTKFQFPPDHLQTVGAAANVGPPPPPQVSAVVSAVSAYPPPVVPSLLPAGVVPGGPPMVRPGMPHPISAFPVSQYSNMSMYPPQPVCATAPYTTTQPNLYPAASGKWHVPVHTKAGHMGGATRPKAVASARPKTGQSKAVKPLSTNAIVITHPSSKDSTLNADAEEFSYSGGNAVGRDADGNAFSLETMDFPELRGKDGRVHTVQINRFNKSSLSQDSDLYKKSNGPLAKESKAVRKRRKRREAADRAAEKELAEITLEQQFLLQNQQQFTMNTPMSTTMNTPSVEPSATSASAVTVAQPLTFANVAASMDGPPPMGTSVIGQPTQSTTPPLGFDGVLSAGVPPSPPPPDEYNTPPPQSATPAEPPRSTKKSKQPIMLNMADMIDALERQRNIVTADPDRDYPPTRASIGVMQMTGYTGYDRNSTKKFVDPDEIPKRGKEREFPKIKKPSPLKKVILKEREEKKLLRLIDDPPSSISTMATMSSPASIGSQALPGSLDDNSELSLSQDQEYSESNKSSSTDFGGYNTPPMSADSPISQSSPFTMSPLSPGGSPLSSGVNSPSQAGSFQHGSYSGMNSVAGTGMDDRTPGVMLKIHSRRFREYCTQVLDKEIDMSCTKLLQDLVRYQDKVYHKNHHKVAKNKRRIVLGLREVTKHLRNCKIKCVMMSPNLERIQSKGGLDDALNQIIFLANQQDVPVVFALGRRALGRACSKIVPVSVVGIFNYDGAEEHFHDLMSLTAKARTTYKEMVMLMEREVANLPVAVRGASGLPQMYAHMGHSRTPSACSAISFASSLLSEPISENYPHSEPETDSRGYEIVKEPRSMDSGTSACVVPAAGPSVEASSGPLRLNSTDTMLDSTGGSARSDDSDCSSDDGSVSSCDTGPSRPQGYVSDDDIETDDLDEAATTSLTPGHSSCVVENGEELDTPGQLPHIDSIHSSIVDVNSEILSQHSSKTATNTQEPMTNGNLEPPVSTTGKDGDLILDKKRIESWVAETQQQLVKKSGTSTKPSVRATTPTELNGNVEKLHRATSNTSLCSTSTCVTSNDTCSVVVQREELDKSRDTQTVPTTPVS